MINKSHISILIILSVTVAVHGMSDQKEDNQSSPPPVVVRSDVEPTKFDYSFEDHLAVYAQRKYAILMAMLRNQLSATESARLENVLIARELVVNSRKRQTDKDYLPKQRKKFDLQIRTEFSDDIADAVISYLKDSSTRSFLAQVNMLLAYRNEPLSTGQMDRLCLIFAAYPALAAPRDAKSNAEIESYLEQRKARDHMIIAEAGEYLSPVQLSALSEETKFRLSYTKVGMARATGNQSQPRKSN